MYKNSLDFTKRPVSTDTTTTTTRDPSPQQEESAAHDDQSEIMVNTQITEISSLSVDPGLSDPVPSPSELGAVGGFDVSSFNQPLNEPQIFSSPIQPIIHQRAIENHYAFS